MFTYLRRRQTAGGSATVEFAIIFPLFVLLLVGMLEFGLTLWRQEIITNASREGARAGIVSRMPRLTDTEITDVVEAYLKNSGLDPALIEDEDISIVCMDKSSMIINCEDGSFGDLLAVLVQYPNSLLVLPHLLPGLDASFKLRARTVMLFE